MTVAEILSRIPKISALVVGDICLDRWCTYDPSTSEPSRETGIPRIGVVSTEITAGAGGTVANNLIALGAGRVSVLGITGDDGFAFELDAALAARGIEAGLMVKEPSIATFTYTKLINSDTGIEDLPRVDFINTRPMPATAEQRVLENLRRVGGEFDVILAGDQLARRYPEKVIFADSRMRIDMFRRVIAKSNQQEAEAASRKLFGTIDYSRLRAAVDAPLLIVTHGPEGAHLIDDHGATLAKTIPVEHPVDICGAGDSFSAGTTLALAAGASPSGAAHFGNLVTSITIMKRGTGTASPAEVLSAEEAFRQ